MPKIKYVEKRFGAKALGTIKQANAIIVEYQTQGFDLTLRQLYYQFVSRDLIANTQREYKNLGSIVNDARLAGLIDWRAIIDRTRNLQGVNHWESPSEILRDCIDRYQTDKWADSETRVEVWVEKDALIGIVENVCRPNDVDYFSCRGYVSQSELWGAARRAIKYNDADQKVVILHLGDHDPSGKDMTRDIEDRFEMFGVERFEVKRIALNIDQVQKYKPPPNPAKTTDSRAKNYIAEFGTKSWELDALEPKVLSKLIEKEILKYRSDVSWEMAINRQEDGQAQILKAAEKLDGK